MKAILFDPVTGRGSPVRLLSEPSWSFAEGVGYEQASMRAELTLAQLASAIGSTITIEDDTGRFWWGFVANAPAPGETLAAVGWNKALTMKPREALYCDTALSPWKQNPSQTANKVLRCQTDAALLRVIAPKDQATGTAATGFVREVPSTTASRVGFDWKRPTTDYRMELRYFTWTPDPDTGSVTPTSTVVWTTDDEGSSLSGTETIDIAATHTGLYFRVLTPTTRTPSADESCYFKNVKVYGVSGITDTKTETIIGDVLTNECDTDYLPAGSAYRAYIGAEGTAIEPLVFTDSDRGAAKIEALAAFARDWHFGWYTERVGGVQYPLPHWQQRSTTPDYIVSLKDAIEHNLQEATLDELASAIRVHYSTEDGRSQYVDVYASDHFPTQYLVQRGIVKFADDITASTTSSATATSLGVLALSDLGRAQVHGDGLWSRVRGAKGNRLVPLTSIRPGSMVRVEKRAGYVDAMLRATGGEGSSAVKLALDNRPWRLARALALLEKRSTK